VTDTQEIDTATGKPIAPAVHTDFRGHRFQVQLAEPVSDGGKARISVQNVAGGMGQYVDVDSALAQQLADNDPAVAELIARAPAPSAPTATAPDLDAAHAALIAAGWTPPRQ
jgi:hypothetical protein